MKKRGHKRSKIFFNRKVIVSIILLMVLVVIIVLVKLNGFSADSTTALPAGIVTSGSTVGSGKTVTAATTATISGGTIAANATVLTSMQKVLTIGLFDKKTKQETNRGNIKVILLGKRCAQVVKDPMTKKNTGGCRADNVGITYNNLTPNQLGKVIMKFNVSTLDLTRNKKIVKGYFITDQKDQNLLINKIVIYNSAGKKISNLNINYPIGLDESKAEKYLMNNNKEVRLAVDNSVQTFPTKNAAVTGKTIEGETALTPTPILATPDSTTTKKKSSLSNWFKRVKIKYFN